MTIINISLADAMDAIKDVVKNFYKGRKKMLNVQMVARICHEANKAYCEAIGDTSQKHWDEAPDNIKRSAIDGVQKYVDGIVTSPIQSHDNWLEFKHKDGWVYGEVKDVEKKTHPCMVDYYSLPEEQRLKDELFFDICRTLLRPFLFGDLDPIEEL